MWHTPYSARAHISGPAILNAIDGADARGYSDLPPVEEAIAAHLWPESLKIKSRVSLDPEIFRELRSATDLALRTTTSTTQSDVSMC